ncbi:MAG: hypothetical protein ACI9HK_005126, partial [Pirellulaceae bacterium]
TYWEGCVIASVLSCQIKRRPNQTAANQTAAAAIPLVANQYAAI